MKKLFALIVAGILLLSLIGCGEQTEPMEVTLLYNENGEPVQATVGADGHTFDVKTAKNGTYYVDLYLDGKQSDRTLHDGPLPDGTDAIAYVDIPIGATVSRPQSGENAYNGDRVVNTYYLDKAAKSPVIVITDLEIHETSGHLVTRTYPTLLDSNGNRVIILSDGEDFRIINVADGMDKIMDSLPDGMPANVSLPVWVSFDSNGEPSIGLILPDDASVSQLRAYRIEKNAAGDYVLKVYTTGGTILYAPLTNLPAAEDADTKTATATGVPANILGKSDISIVSGDDHGDHDGHDH